MYLVIYHHNKMLEKDTTGLFIIYSIHLCMRLKKYKFDTCNLFLSWWI